MTRRGALSYVPTIAVTESFAAPLDFRIRRDVRRRRAKWWRAARVVTLAVLVGGVAHGVLRPYLDWTVNVVLVGLALIFIAFLIRHLLFVTTASMGATRDLLRPPGAPPDFWPYVTILVPCHNESLVVDGLCEALLALDYPRYLLQIVLVNDNSSDDTAERLEDWRAYNSGIEVMHRGPEAKHGKSAALNDAISIARGDIVVIFDADHTPTPSVLRSLVRPFEQPDVGLVQGRCVVRNPHESPIARLVAIDFLCGYLVDMYGRAMYAGVPAYGGANCAVRADLLRDLGGWNEESVTEDTDITLRAMLAGWRVAYEIRAVDREEAVLTLRRYWNQRYRWARGHQQVFRDYWRQALTARHLSTRERIELMMFLFVYHVPVLCALGCALFVLTLTGFVRPFLFFEPVPIIPLMLAGPLIEVAAGLVVGRADRRLARSLPLFLPLFFVAMGLCTKAWFDGVRGGKYRWVKTPRSELTAANAANAATAGSEGGLANPESFDLSARVAA